MDALSYEYLIRRVNGCGRYGVNGANADIYRKMETAESNLTNPHWNKSLEDKEYEYRRSFSEVRRHVEDAIKKGIKDVDHKLSSTEKQTLREIFSKLTPSFFDRKELDKIIGQSDEIFRKHGLEVR